MKNIYFMVVIVAVVSITIGVTPLIATAADVYTTLSQHSTTTTFVLGPNELEMQAVGQVFDLPDCTITEFKALVSYNSFTEGDTLSCDVYDEDMVLLGNLGVIAITEDPTPTYIEFHDSSVEVSGEDNITVILTADYAESVSVSIYVNENLQGYTLPAYLMFNETLWWFEPEAELEQWSYTYRMTYDLTYFITEEEGEPEPEPEIPSGNNGILSSSDQVYVSLVSLAFSASMVIAIMVMAYTRRIAPITAITACILAVVAAVFTVQICHVF